MATIEYTVGDLVTRMSDGLKINFGKDQFLPKELEEAIQGVINSVRWSVLRLAEQQAEGGEFTKTIEVIKTTYHFSTSVMDDEEIVDRVEDTSGLSRESAAYCLQVIEKIVDTVVDKGDTLRLGFLGEIRAAEHGVYTIDLNESLQVRSPRLASASIQSVGSGDTTESADTEQPQKARTAGMGENYG